MLLVAVVAGMSVVQSCAAAPSSSAGVLEYIIDWTMISWVEKDFWTAQCEEHTKATSQQVVTVSVVMINVKNMQVSYTVNSLCTARLARYITVPWVKQTRSQGRARLLREDFQHCTLLRCERLS